MKKIYFFKKDKKDKKRYELKNKQLTRFTLNLQTIYNSFL